MDFGDWFLLAVVVGIIILAVMFWFVTIPLVGIGIWIYFINKKKKEEAERKAKEEARLQRHREEQQGYRKQMVDLGEQTIGLFESMPQHLDSAEKWLDRAEVDFADSAFAPFWDSVENATKWLAHFDEGIHHIKDNSLRYTELIKKYEDTSPQFPLARQSVEKLGVGSVTAKRMQSIVRQAQRNFQFATIYEQRKTNQILVAGFTNLANALNEMTWRITDSINNLAGSIDGMASTLSESMQAIHSRIGDIHEEFSKEASERTVREEKALEMLDNIQRRRKPSLLEGPRP
jgi:hypothetical protein